jgi:hypothetical protein
MGVKIFLKHYIAGKEIIATLHKKSALYIMKLPKNNANLK